MIFLSEYSQRHKTAHVFKRLVYNDFVVVCYDNGLETIGHPFEQEQAAEDYAEDWVLGAVSTEQQTTVTRGCCD